MHEPTCSRSSTHTELATVRTTQCARYMGWRGAVTALLVTLTVVLIILAEVLRSRASRRGGT